MANRNRIDTPNIQNQKEYFHPPKLFSPGRPQFTDKSDDVIVTLSDAYENQRARQVGEWEKLYGKNVYRAGS